MNKSKFKTYEPDQMMMVTFDSSIKFPEDSFERFLVNILSQIDISSFYAEDKKDKGGERPYNPRALLGVIFYGIVKGIFSSRKLEYQCEHNDAFIFVSGFCKPDHSTICNFINEHGAGIDEVFTQMVYISHKAGYVNMKTCSFDGTKMKANAAKEFTGTLEDFEKKKNRLIKKINRLLEKLKNTDSIEDKKEAAELKKKMEKLKKRKEKISRFLSQASKDMSKKGGRERKQNITDNDSRLMRDSKQGGSIQGYNAQSVVDGEHQIIVAAKVVSNENDTRLFEPMYEELQKEKEKNNIEPAPTEEKCLMDNGYYTLNTLKFAKDNAIDIYSPPCADKDFYTDEAVIEKTEAKKEKITFKDCELSQDEEEYKITCPHGLQSSKCSISKDKKSIALSIVETEKCRSCNSYEGCRGQLKNKRWKKFAFSLLHFTMKQEIKAYKEKMATEEAKQIYRDRFKVEHPFAHIKNVFNVRGFNHRGLYKVNVIWKLLCSAHNLRRMYSLGVPLPSG